MEREVDNEMENLMEDIVDDMRGARDDGIMDRRKGAGYGLDPRKVFVFIGLVIIVLVLLVFFLLRGCSGVSQKDLTALQTKLDFIGQKVIRLEGLADKRNIQEKQQKESGQSLEEAGRTLKALSRRVDQVERKWAALQGRLSALEAGLKAREPARGTTAKPAQAGAATVAGKRQHEVSKGETIYSISRKYGISVDELYRLNPEVAKRKTIYPGQKLLVAP